MFCNFCGSLNAHHEIVCREVDCGRHQLNEEDVEVVFCPDCARIQTESEASDRIRDWLNEIGEETTTLSCRWHLPDGTILVDHDDDMYEEE